MSKLMETLVLQDPTKPETQAALEQCVQELFYCHFAKYK